MMDRRSVLLTAVLLFYVLTTSYAYTWTEITSIGGTRTWKAITSSNGGTKLAAVEFNTPGGNIWASTDSGANWTVVGATTAGTAGTPWWRCFLR